MNLFGVLFLHLMIRYVVSEGVNSSVRWLPKCCPMEKQIAGDGKSCVTDTTATSRYPEMVEDLLLLSERNETLSTKLVYKSLFKCIKPEMYVIQDDLHLTEDDRVRVLDEGGVTWILEKSELCVDSIEGLSIPRVYLALLCPDCQRVSCLHKCCPEGQQLQVVQDGDPVVCVPAPDSNSWSRHFLPNTGQLFVFHGFPECDSMYLDFPDQPLGLSEHGHLRLRRMTVPRGEYCADASDRGHALLGCRQLQAASAILKPTLYGGMFCLGSMFLAITLVLHLWLPELRKSLHSRVLVAHVASLLVSFLGLAIVNLAALPVPSPICSATAFVIQFSILAAMFWLNIMCVDIAWTFSNVRAPKASSTMDSDGHKFLYYSLYVWGCTAGISTVTALLEYTDLVPYSSHFKPAFGITSCWFQHWEPMLFLLYLPMAILLMMNIVLFTYTANSIRKTHRDAANLVQHVGTKLRENTDRFGLYLKLFGLMGVTWVFEIVSWMVGGPESYWYFTDSINALRGFFIFILFCLKKKVILLIKSKFVKSGPKFPIHSRKSVSSSKLNSSITSQRTNSIQLSHVA